MAQRTVLDCDACPAKAVECQTLRICVGHEFDGVETVDDVRSVDLCPKCLGVELQELLKKQLDNEKRNEWVVKLARKRG